MKRLLALVVCLFVLVNLALVVEAKGPKTPPGQAKKDPTQTDITLFLSNYGLSAADQAAFFFLASQAGIQTNLDEIVAVWQMDLSGVQVALRLGYPPVLLDGALLTWRHPLILHSPLPLVRESHKKRFRHSWGSETLERKPGKFEYAYENRLSEIYEKIEIKENKYSYAYKSKVIEEKLELQLSAGRYEYSYRNRLTGEEIHRSGKAELIRWREMARYLPKSSPVIESSKPVTPELSFKFEFEFNFD